MHAADVTTTRSAGRRHEEAHHLQTAIFIEEDDDVVPALRQRDGTCGPAAAGPVVHDELSVQIDQAAVIGKNPEGVGAGLLRQELAGPAYREFVDRAAIFAGEVLAVGTRIKRLAEATRSSDQRRGESCQNRVHCLRRSAQRRPSTAGGAVEGVVIILAAQSLVAQRRDGRVLRDRHAVGQCRADIQRERAGRNRHGRGRIAWFSVKRPCRSW